MERETIKIKPHVAALLGQNILAATNESSKHTLLRKSNVRAETSQRSNPSGRPMKC